MESESVVAESLTTLVLNDYQILLYYFKRISCVPAFAALETVAENRNEVLTLLYVHISSSLVLLFMPDDKQHYIGLSDPPSPMQQLNFMTAIYIIQLSASYLIISVRVEPTIHDIQ